MNEKQHTFYLAIILKTLNCKLTSLKKVRLKLIYMHSVKNRLPTFYNIFVLKGLSTNPRPLFIHKLISPANHDCQK